MGLLSKVFGRTPPVRPQLDQLFAIPGAALTLESALDLKPTGLGSVSFRAAEGGAAASVTTDAQALLDSDGGPKVERSVDSYGFTWLLVRHDPDDVPGLVTELHAVNSDLENSGFGSSLLCSLVSFSDGARRLGLVYLYKRGTFYPFAPLDGERRDNALELQVRAALADDLTIEPDLSRWFPVWGAPGL
ncbi:MAG: PspA-associated protein PspAB [Actinomycetes bacterium]